MTDTEKMYSHGTVKKWNNDEGIGVIDSADTPGGCWVNFSHLVMNGYHTLSVGDHVTFTFEAAQQDGFDYRAVLVWPPGVKPGTQPATPRPATESAAYRSSLNISESHDGTP